jgi:hypothetical protein
MKKDNPIEKIMNSLDAMDSAKAPPDFCQKVQIKIVAVEDKRINLLRDKSWQSIAAAVLLLIATNVGVIINFSDSESSGEVSEVLASDYDLLVEDGFDNFSTSK